MFRVLISYILLVVALIAFWVYGSNGGTWEELIRSLAIEVMGVVLFYFVAGILIDKLTKDEEENQRLMKEHEQTMQRLEQERAKSQAEHEQWMREHEQTMLRLQQDKESIAPKLEQQQREFDEWLEDLKQRQHQQDQWFEDFERKMEQDDLRNKEAHQNLMRSLEENQRASDKLLTTVSEAKKQLLDNKSHDSAE